MQTMQSIKEKKMDRLTVDRIEGEMAVCELPDRTMTVVSLRRFTKRPKDGDKVFLGKDGLYEIDEAGTLIKKKEIKARLNSLFEDE